MPVRSWSEAFGVLEPSTEVFWSDPLLLEEELSSDFELNRDENIAQIDDLSVSISISSRKKNVSERTPA